MTTYVAVLYSTILAPGRRLLMADLRQLAAELGLANPRTLVATGNLVFEAPRQKLAGLERKLEMAFAQRFGKHVDIIVRTAQDWKNLAAGNPFAEESRTNGQTVMVRIMRDPLPPESAKELEPRCLSGERIAIVDGDLWVHFSKGLAATRLVPFLTPKRYGIGTIRNANTVYGVLDLLDSG